MHTPLRISKRHAIPSRCKILPSRNGVVIRNAPFRTRLATDHVLTFTIFVTGTDNVPFDPAVPALQHPQGEQRPVIIESVSEDASQNGL
jgi:hypothetical protein